MQDVHWFSGWIGYYQCYVLANCYDGHFLHSSMKDIPDFWEKVSRGEFDEINDWHNRKVRCTGNLYSPMETLYRFSGETLTFSTSRISLNPSMASEEAATHAGNGDAPAPPGNIKNFC